MSKILVVEPHRMLQQAIVLALFPEHEVKSASALPEPSELEDFAAVIVDAESLGEPGEESASAIRAVHGWKIPTLWVQGPSNGPAPQREKLVVLKTPIEREVLLSALAECLGTASKQTRLEKPAGSVRAKDSRAGAAAAAGGPEVIELLEVVEEGSEAEIQPVPRKK